MASGYIGKEVSRLDGKLKVTGGAKYAGDYDVADLLHGYVVNSSVTRGKITRIDTMAALALPGVVAVFTHENRPRLALFDLQYADMDAPPGNVFRPLYDNEIRYNGQPIALVVAQDFETARYAASLLEVHYEEQPFQTHLTDHLAKARKPNKGLATLVKPPPPKPTGNFEKAYANSPHQVDATYHHSAEYHNPIELFATTTVYEGKGKLTIYDKTQGTLNSQIFVANVFGLAFKNVQVLAPFVGGAFGSGLRPQYQLFFSVMAALELKRHVRVVLDRKQMFTFGHRPETTQHLRFSADADGRLIAMNHNAISETSQFEDYAEIVAGWSHKLYPAPNTLFDYKVVPLDVYTPIDMRAPGGVTAMHAIECTMDELAYSLNMDPLQFRLKNYATGKEPASGKPFTSKALHDCFLQAAERFGWGNRKMEPRGLTRGNRLVGYGMATGIWDAYQFPARVQMAVTSTGQLMVHSAVTDIGTGTLTIMAQMAADAMGISIDDVHIHHADSAKPFSMFQGGSATTASISSAIVVTAAHLQKKLLKKAASLPGSAFKGLKADDVFFESGSIRLKAQPEVGLTYAEIVSAGDAREIKTTRLGSPQLLKLRKYAKLTHSAAFVEVEVDRDLGTITVTKVVVGTAAGRIINPKTARSQILGSIVWGISKALHEETLMDKSFGKCMNDNLAEYHIPVHADINQLEVIFADEKDEIINELGIKGVGEIGIVAVPAAIANAIFHATGKRVNSLPIKAEYLIS